MLVSNGKVNLKGSPRNKHGIWYEVSFEFTKMVSDMEGDLTDISETSFYCDRLDSSAQFRNGVKSFNSLFENKAANIENWVRILNYDVLADAAKKMMPMFERIMNTVFDYRVGQVNPGGASIPQLYVKDGHTAQIWSTVNHLFDEHGHKSNNGKVVEMLLSDAISILKIDSSLLPSTKKEFALFTFLFMVSDDVLGEDANNLSVA